MPKQKSISKNQRKQRAIPLPDRLFEIAKQNPSGFTVRVVNGKITPFDFSKTERFVISTTNNITKKQIRKEFRGFKNGIAGGWYDKKTGNYYIDKNIAVESESKAFSLGRKYKQKAVFDYKTKKAIDVPHETKIAKKKKRKKYRKSRSIRIERHDKRIQRYNVMYNPYERGYFYDSKRKAWVHAKRFTYYASRGFYRIDTVEPDMFFSTSLIYKKMFSGYWYPLSYFNHLLNKILRPSLSRKSMWYQCYRFFAYEYKRGYFYYRNEKLHLLILEEHSRERS